MSDPLIIDGLHKKYGDVVALHDMTFTVQPGEIFGFVGSNGAGKSTTMRIILGVLAADSGTVALGDRPIDLPTRRRIGYMPEERGLYPKMKVGDQLRFLARLHGMSAAQADESAHRWTERLGVATRFGDNVADLSLGNQQRVQLAAALIADPAVLVLDEPFSGLDPVAVDVMSDVLKEKAAEGIPVIFSSHQLDLVQRLCDRVGIVVKGQMRALGSVESLRARGGVTLEVEGPGIGTAWADGIPGVLDTDYGPTTLLRIDPDSVDDQQVLAAALHTGPVHRFTRSTPSLTDMFREVVSA
ncbi:putative ABC transporter ATP-binding protein [Gordonia polyisoprenivorans NBRC 16320 = JCM 10675]|uniref:ABC transporter ATP-binding protein n=1 Tax=Gordonia polyisoprenivorans TaxID=84595 RepID=A0A846WQW7_9ACTN|nr:ATP-binding cassette domain-containing protein [Gordonia polyisoprenivorans]MBE7192617.1 ATP-binding cassette domain-containing protein [Gordonia polyisoprenivorans]NKY03170.1 ABC transporter ATP-binding protein [Gordonia polyisoprenivorans]OZC31902.1 ABC transporter ATP-binding protein [Gordonia polyisoprenivorans]UZF55269.1 ATP-binding cassette domain-containing protein [Gordonia polyisoprenivorans]WCB36443.1 ATP-binding cassette domain-containing protein [Gordonia polyisoprenivorans]